MAGLKSVFLYSVLISVFLMPSCAGTKKHHTDMTSFACISPPAEYSPEVNTTANAELEKLANISAEKFSDNFQKNNSKILDFFQARVDVDIFLYKVCMNKNFTKEQSHNATERLLYLWEKAVQINPRLLNADPL